MNWAGLLFRVVADLTTEIAICSKIFQNIPRQTLKCQSRPNGGMILVSKSEKSGQNTNMSNKYWHMGACFQERSQESWLLTTFLKWHRLRVGRRIDTCYTRKVRHRPQAHSSHFIWDSDHSAPAVLRWAWCKSFINIVDLSKSARISIISKFYKQIHNVSKFCQRFRKFVVPK